MFNIGLSQVPDFSVTPALDNAYAHLHRAIGSGKSPTSECLAIMIEVEAINRETHLLRERIVLLLLRQLRGDPILHLWLSHDGIAIELIATPNQNVVRLLCVLLQ